MDISYMYLYVVWLILLNYITLILEYRYVRIKIIFENWLNGDALQECSKVFFLLVFLFFFKKEEQERQEKERFEREMEEERIAALEEERQKEEEKLEDEKRWKDTLKEQMLELRDREAEVR